MIKLVYCVKRREDISEEDFRTYWLEKHGPLVRSYAKALGAIRYVQSHTLPNSEINDFVRQTRGSKEAYDGLTEVWWNSLEDLMQVLQTPEGKEVNRILTEDEGTFVDLKGSSLFFADEHTIFDD